MNRRRAGQVNSTPSPSGPAQRFRKKKYIRWSPLFKKLGFEDHSDAIELCSLTCTSILVLFILIWVILYPGPVYCSDSSCPGSGPVTFNSTRALDDHSPSLPYPAEYDTALLIVGLSGLSIAAVLHLLVILCPAGMMDHPRYMKSLALLAILSSCCSGCQLISSSMHRHYVLSLYSVKPYEVEVIRESSDMANVSFPFVDSTVITGKKYSFVGYEVDDDVNQLWDIHPTAKRLFTEDDVSEISNINGYGKIVSPLRNDKKYVFTIVVATKESGNVRYTDDPYAWRSSIDSEGIGEKFSSVWVDRRLFVICTWNSVQGCTSKVH